MKVLFGSTYFNLITTILYLLIFFGFGVILFEIFKTITKNKKMAVWIIIIPILTLINIPPQYSINNFTHEDLAEVIAENPFQNKICSWFENGECIQKFNVAWTHTYHIVLSTFKKFGSRWIQLFNAFCLFLTLFFGHLLAQRAKKSLVWTVAFVTPVIFFYLSTPILGYLSLAIGIVTTYFLVKLLEGEQVHLKFALVSALFIHIRPENFIYLLIMLIPIADKLLKSLPALGILTSSLILKRFEYFRGILDIGVTSSDWSLNLTYRLTLLTKLFLRNFLFFFNPLNFNLFFIILIFIGIFATLKKKKFIPFIVLPLLAIAIYTTKIPGIYFSLYNPFSSKYLLNLIVASAPIIYFGMKNSERKLIPLAFLMLIPFTTMQLIPSYEYLIYKNSVGVQEEIIQFANNNSMTVYSIIPDVFKDANRSIWIMDNFQFPSGQYLAIEPSSYHLDTHKNICEIAPLKAIGNLTLYNFTCISSI